MVIRPSRPCGLEGHGPLQGSGTHICRDLSRTPDRLSVEGRLGGFLNDSSNEDGQIRGAVEYQYAVVGQQDCRDPGSQGITDVGNRFVRPAGPISSERNPVGETEHGQCLDPTADLPVGYGKGGCVRRVRVNHTLNFGVILIERRVG